jgi:hypothetical protein
MRDLRFIKALWSPFKSFKLNWYCGKIARGTPHFYPRKWVKATPERAHEATLDCIKSTEEFNKRNPEYTYRIKSYDEIFADKMRCSYAVPKKFGFNFWGLGWKTKWRSDNIRFEYAPGISFVFFKWQIVVSVNAYEQDHYWECWIYYEYYTDKTKSRKERIEQCIKDFPQIWTTYKNEHEEKTNYYELILREKWIKKIKWLSI